MKPVVQRHQVHPRGRPCGRASGAGGRGTGNSPSSDSGVGISPEFLPHVFEHFRQQDAGTTRQHGGLGLGLALVRHVVELHGGSVQAESEGNDCGATFRVRLPLKIVELSNLRQTRAAQAATRLDGIRVLVVDDQAEARTLAASALLGAGGLVTTAASALDALKMLKADTPEFSWWPPDAG